MHIYKVKSIFISNLVITLFMLGALSFCIDDACFVYFVIVYVLLIITAHTSNLPLLLGAVNIIDNKVED